MFILNKFNAKKIFACQFFMFFKIVFYPYDLTDVSIIYQICYQLNNGNIERYVQYFKIGEGSSSSVCKNIIII